MTSKPRGATPPPQPVTPTAKTVATPTAKTAATPTAKTVATPTAKTPESALATSTGRAGPVDSTDVTDGWIDPPPVPSGRTATR